MRCLCFFFQAEDGIRDPLVTGVQTCALPISGRVSAMVLKLLAPFWRVRSGKHSVILSINPQRHPKKRLTAKFGDLAIHEPYSCDDNIIIGARSEERRVGKECRFRWSQ